MALDDAELREARDALAAEVGPQPRVPHARKSLWCGGIGVTPPCLCILLFSLNPAGALSFLLVPLFWLGKLSVFLLPVCPLLSLFALISGIRALRAARRLPNAAGAAEAQAGLVLGLLGPVCLAVAVARMASGLRF